MKRFEGKIAVIFGGADGLGKGIAGRIASDGGTDCYLKLTQSTSALPAPCNSTTRLAIPG